MTDIRKGSFCKSAAGHDKGTIYIVMETEKGIAVSDGKFKTLNNMKKKNAKHLKVLNYTDPVLEEKIAAGKLQNEDIKYSIKQYLTHIDKK